MISLGDTFFMKPPGTVRNHLWVVLAVHNNGASAILANLTSRRENSDTTCVLMPGMHPYIKHESCVHYRGMIDRNVDRIPQESRREQASVDMLRLMQQGAINHPFADPELVSIIASQIR